MLPAQSLGAEKHTTSLEFPLALTGNTAQDANALHLGNVQSTGRRRRRGMAGVLLGVLLALHAAAAFPALHHLLHGDHDPSECHESDCVVLAFANGSIDPGPAPGPVTRPVLLVASEAIPIVVEMILGHDHARPPGRGPPIP